ncbi:MAG: type II toxin-antitoxin system RelE/ParE family toxin [Firmicutes bacterium]|nr:type II toxin-antitoxin system RelE/ParE family toxin [Bacillota bacterium]
MKYPIMYSPAAVRDLDRTWSEVFDASKSIDIADRYVEELMEAVKKKEEFPASGSPLYYEDLFTGYYYVVFKAYIAFYRIESGKVLVDRVLYGKSEYLRKLDLE